MAAGKGHPAKEKKEKQSPTKQKTTAAGEGSPGPKKQPTKKKTIKEEKKVSLFEDKNEKDWQDASPNGKMEGKIGGLGTVAEEDPNVFHGEPNIGDASP